MTTSGLTRTAAALGLVLALSGCAQRAGGAAGGTDPAAPSADLPGDPAALVLRAEYTGGFVAPSVIAGRLPIISVYADGRVISEGPVAAIYPGPALPNVQVQQIDGSEVQALADQALAAGVAETADLGTPPIADAASTRFTLATADGTHVREVYALVETPMEEGPIRGVSAEQAAARQKLADLLATLTDLPQAGTQAYSPTALAAIVTPWVDPGDGLTPPDVAWPGPALPGEPTGGLPDVTCVAATGDQAPAVLAAATSANSATPWVTPDGTRWSVAFRPLLPDESGCADLTD